MDVGVVGLGVVGKATAQLFSRQHTVESYDVNGTGTCSSLRELGRKVEVAFVCVPTPSGLFNRLDVAAVRQVCRDLEGACVVAVRSTVPIGTCKSLDGQVVYNPEFCNARTAYEDMVTADRILLAGRSLDSVKLVARVYENTGVCGKLYVYDAWEHAEAVKLVTNAAMATRIAFANEAKAVCEANGACWSDVAHQLAADERLGWCGWQVPGPDGLPGFGGACLPKDLAGFVAQAADSKTPARVALAAQTLNAKIRRGEKK